MAATLKALHRGIALCALVASNMVWCAQQSGPHALYEDWAVLLQRSVIAGSAPGRGEVDYAWLQRHRPLLDRTTEGFSAVSPAQYEQWPQSNQLAFLINAYNAMTLQLILTAYPDLDSIKDLGSLFRSPWKRRFFSLLGARRSLDELEHDMIRAGFNEPRIHFAVNCASCGCPALQAQPYAGAKLDEQLDQALRAFLSDPARNQYQPAGPTLILSPLFKWYREDFEKTGDRLDFLRPYAHALGWDGQSRPKLEFSRYDWTLNDRGRCAD